MNFEGALQGSQKKPPGFKVILCNFRAIRVGYARRITREESYTGREPKESRRVLLENL